jgi:hypothetical protein
MRHLEQVRMAGNKEWLWCLLRASQQPFRLRADRENRKIFINTPLADLDQLRRTLGHWSNLSG